MEKRGKDQYARVSAQITRTRKLYSQVGEPLPADVIIDLYQHLGTALSALDERETSLRRVRRKRADA